MCHLAQIAHDNAETFMALLRQSADCVLLIGSAGRLQPLNDAAQTFLAAHQSSLAPEAPSIAWPDLWSATSRILAEASLDRARAGHAAHFEAHQHTVLAQSRWWDVALMAGGGKAAAPEVVAVLRDVSHRHADKAGETELRALVAQLRAEQDRLSQARADMGHLERLRLLGQFAGSIVHDLNNVLAVMQSASALLRRHLPDPKGTDILNHVDQAVIRSAQLTRQLLDFARNDAGTAEIIDLRALLARDLGLMRHLAGPDIELTLEADDDLAPILAPFSRIQSVVFNLVANARDAIAGPGHIRLHLRNRILYGRVGDLPAGRYVTLEVQDDGGGMPPEIVARLGEAFFTTKGAGKGTGLGMPSAFELATMCAGTVEIDTAPGEGTCIRLVLGASPARGQIFDGTGGRIDPALHGNATLLLVENDTLFRQHIAAFLRSLGYAVWEAAGAAAAIASAVTAAKIDLLITDLLLDDQDGLAVAQALRGRFPDLPIIFLSGAAGRGIPAGEILLRKPLDTDILGQVIAERLGRLPASHLTEI